MKQDGTGITVRGCKAHQTGAVNSHWIAVVPTTAMKEADKDYAVAFVTPTKHKGITYVYGRQSCDTRKMEGGAIDVGNCSLEAMRPSSFSTTFLFRGNKCSCAVRRSIRGSWSKSLPTIIG